MKTVATLAARYSRHSALQVLAQPAEVALLAFVVGCGPNVQGAGGNQSSSADQGASNSAVGGQVNAAQAKSSSGSGRVASTGTTAPGGGGVGAVSTGIGGFGSSTSSNSVVSTTGSSTTTFPQCIPVTGCITVTDVDPSCPGKFVRGYVNTCNTALNCDFDQGHGMGLSFCNIPPNGSASCMLYETDTLYGCDMAAPGCLCP